MSKIPEIPPYRWYRYPDDCELLETGAIYCAFLDLGTYGDKMLFLSWGGHERGWRMPEVERFSGADDVEVLDISHFMHIPFPDSFD